MDDRVEVTPGAAIIQVIREITARTFRQAAPLDRDDAFPLDEIRMLHEGGLLLAPFPAAMGGTGLGATAASWRRTLTVLRLIGAASLPLGRLFEGHVNAIGLVSRYGSRANLELLWEEATAGRLTGVWMAEQPPGLCLSGTGAAMLSGAKTYCSGAGHIRRPLVAAALAGAAGPQMVIPYVPPGDRSSTAAWRALGMKASATGDVDFSGLPVTPDERVGRPNDYYQSPYFRGGAWRVLAVQLGGLEALFDQYRRQLAAGSQPAETLQLSRFGEAASALETARLWVNRAADMVETHDIDPIEKDAYVDLARGAFEQAAWGVMERAQRGLGLRAMIAPNPFERILRDLTTYLRQPALDLSLISAAGFILNHDGPSFDDAPFLN